MMEKLQKLLDPYLPQDIALKALKKIDPKIGKFIGKATAAGFATEMIMDFIRDRVSFSSQSERRDREDVGALKTSEKNQRKGEDILKAGAALAGGALAGIGATGRTAGALTGELLTDVNKQENIPGIGYEDQQMIEYQEPEEMSNRYPRQIEGEEQKRLEYKPEGYGEPTGETLQKGATELLRFVRSLVDQGATPRYAAERAKRDKRFTSDVQKIEAQFQMPFPDYVEGLFDEEMTKGSPEQRGEIARQEQEQLRQAQQPRRRPMREDPRQMDMFDQQRGNDIRSQQMELFQQNQQMLNDLMKRLGQ